MQKIQLSIPEPCHENWDKMTTTQQGRFCNACAKEVVDFSTMTDTQVLNYFTENISQKVCGRAYPDQLDRVIAMPERPKRKWYWNYAAAFFLLFAKSNESKAQGMVAVKKTEKVAPKKTPKVVCTKPADTAIRIRVGGAIATPVTEKPVIIIDGVAYPEKDLKDFDPNKITSMTIMKGDAAKILYGNIAGQYGAILITTKNTDTLPVYKKLDEVKVTCSPTTTGAVRRVTSGMMISRREKKITIKDTLKTFVNSIADPMKIYPNPTRRGQTFTVTFSAKQNSNYSLQVFNSAGIILLQQEVIATAKNHNQQLQADSRWASGVYYIRIFDDKNKLINKSSFIVQ